MADLTLTPATTLPGATVEAKPRHAPGHTTLPSAPTPRPPSGSPERLVWAVIPCFNRPADLALVLEDLAALDLAVGAGGSVRLRVLVVDNASAAPLSGMAVPPGLEVEFLRLRENTGGAGGYNAGMARVLAEGRRSGATPDFVWLVDSDVRLEAGALRGLVDCLDANPDAAAAGSAIADMQDGSIFEVGGRVERLWGQFGPRYGGDRMPAAPVVECTYTAACSALVRSESIERTGLFPDVFLNADDVEWFIRMRAATGQRVLATTDSVVRHPFFGRYATMPRYFMSRNAYGPLDALGLGWRVRLCRALRDVPRAVAQIMVGRDDLADLHFRGLADAARGVRGAAPSGTMGFERPRAFESLAETLGPMLEPGRTPTVFLHKRVVLPIARADELNRQLARVGLRTARIQRGFFNVEHESMFHGFVRALWRLLVAGPTADIAIIHARGRPMAWCRGRIQVLISHDGYVIRRLDRRGALLKAVRGAWRGVGLALRVARRRRTDAPALPSVAEFASRLPAMAE